MTAVGPSGATRAQVRAATVAAEAACVDSEVPDAARMLLALEVARSEGSTCVPLDELEDAFERLGFSRAQALGARTFCTSTSARPLVAVEHGAIFSTRFSAAEDRVARRLAGRLSEAPRYSAPEVAAALRDVAARPRRFSDGSAERWTEAQTKAITAAVTGSFAAISGGPGTGKTSIVVSILRVLARLGANPGAFALGAPTGRAADRLTSSIADALASVQDPTDHDRGLAALQGAQTLHRLLGWSELRGRFRFDESLHLPHRFVIVDECSMMDLGLADALLSAARDTATVVWLGDAEQLPAVAAGAPFGELSALESLLVRLDRSFRMRADDFAGSHVLEVAELVRRGRAHDALAALRARGPGELEDQGVEWLEPTRLPEVLERWRRAYADVLRDLLDSTELDESSDALRAAFRLLGAARLLCSTRLGRLGSDSLARALSTRGDGTIGPGDAVLVTRNDPSRGLVNGDLGVVATMQVRGRARELAVFEKHLGPDRKLLEWPLAELSGSIELAHASTVHRAQGQEHDRVMLVLGDVAGSRIETRSLVYTAVTRARHSVLIVAGRDELERAILRKEPRASRLRERLNSMSSDESADKARGDT
ncbi:MAG: AAA family ATPase [Deltaproteobacteria bacterium]|nr:AAA family ATPase [Deltaproteobacteria bacterium]